MKPQFQQLDFFTKYSSLVYKTLYEKSWCRNVGLHIFSAAFYTPKKKKKKKCEKKSNWCFREFDLIVLLKIQSDFGKYFIHSCKDEILLNIKTYKMKRISHFAKIRIDRAVNYVCYS